MSRPLAPPGRLVRWLEPLLRLPYTPPQPPLGARDPRVFRAAPAYLRYRYCLLGLAALVALPEVLAVAGGMFTQGVTIALITGGLLTLLGVAALTVSYVAIRLDYDLRQYVVTDRALRVRTGAIVVREATITYANVQDVEISQGPIQRLFKIADLVVHTAGGGSHKGSERKGGTAHRGALAGIEDPHEVRDLILARLRAFRDAGLGDPEDARMANAAPAPPSGGAIDAALAGLAAAARELREAVGGGRLSGP